MQLYVGTKTLKARPMSRGEYNTYRGWEIPADENPQDAGYLVEYTDGGKANHPDHEGYISWSPAEVFDKAYVSIDYDLTIASPHLKRLAAEHAQLKNRVNLLQEFLRGDLFTTLEKEEQQDLVQQNILMAETLVILAKRMVRALT